MVGAFWWPGRFLKVRPCHWTSYVVDPIVSITQKLDAIIVESLVNVIMDQNLDDIIFAV